MNDTPNDKLDVNVVYAQYLKEPTEQNYEKIFLAAERLIDKFVTSLKQTKNYSDLAQSGYLGLMKAIKSYRDDAGTKFSTWASTCIISEIRHEIRREQRFFNFNNKKSSEEHYSAGLISLTTEDGRSKIENEQDLKAENATKDHLDLKIILESLSDLDRQIVDFLFFKDYSQEEVAAILGISQKKVSRQKAKIINLLKVEMNQTFKLSPNEMTFKLIK